MLELEKVHCRVEENFTILEQSLTVILIQVLIARKSSRIANDSKELFFREIVDEIVSLL